MKKKIYMSEIRIYGIDCFVWKSSKQGVMHNAVSHVEHI